jgi:hypothetical protein
MRGIAGLEQRPCGKRDATVAAAVILVRLEVDKHATPGTQ